MAHKTFYHRRFQYFDPSSPNYQQLRPGCSPDETLAVVAMKESDTVTFLNLNSGDVQLTINLGMEVYGLRVTENAIGVICLKKVIIWNLPASDSVPDARMKLEGSARTIELSHELNNVSGVAISSDFRHIATNKFGTLRLYSTSTGESLGQIKPKWDAYGTPWFSPDGCDVWGVDSSGWADVFRIGGEQNMLHQQPCKKTCVVLWTCVRTIELYCNRYIE